MIPTVRGRRERHGHSKGTLFCCRESSYSTPETRKVPRSPPQRVRVERSTVILRDAGHSCVVRRALMALTPMSAPARMPSALSVVTIAST